MSITFTIPGNPRGKERPRATRAGHIYTPEKTRTYERAVREIYQSAGNGEIQAPIEITINCFYPIPKSATKGARDAMKGNKTLPVKKPDLDNVIKIICDALNRIAWRDDADICRITATKLHSEDPRVEVTITHIDT